MSLGDEDVAIGSDRDIVGLIEVLVAACASSRFAESEQEFPVRAELENLMPLPILPLAVGDPDIVLFVDGEAVREDNNPPPKLLRSLPDSSNSRIGSTVLPAQELAPHRSATQMCPLESISTALVEPMILPSGRVPQLAMVRYGFGCELGSLEAWRLTHNPPAASTPISASLQKLALTKARGSEP